jgi:predicted glycosyltransferase
MKVWIDLANSPHPLIFAPVVARLEAEGVDVAITYRDHAQTAPLTVERWPSATLIGGVSPSGRVAKSARLASRVGGLARWARRRRPDVALSHNSYAQIVAARSLRLPAVTAMDYEHQPANHLAFRAAQRILVPDALDPQILRRQGASDRKLIRYRGLKEELYLGDFTPDPAILESLGIRREAGGAVAVVRTSPAGATYHRSENPLMIATLQRLGSQEHVSTIVLARHPEQRRAVAELRLPRVRVADGAVDSRSLMCVADLFVGAGGTMTREAALLGVPTFSIFAGRRPAADLALERRGLLRRLDHAAELPEVVPRDGHTVQLTELRARGREIEDVFVHTTLDLAVVR